MNELKRGNSRKSNYAFRIIAALAVLLVVGALLFFIVRQEKKHLRPPEKAQTKKIYSSQWISGKGPSGQEPLSAKDSAALKAYEAAYAEDSANRAREGKSVETAEHRKVTDSLKAALKAAEAARIADSLESIRKAEEEGAASKQPAPNVSRADCSKDTLAPTVLPDSAGGLHMGPAHVFLQTNKPCTVYWRFEPDTSWHVWNADTFVIDCTVTLAYKATDRCGRSTEPRQDHYDIKPLGYVAGAPELPAVNCATDTVPPWVYLDPAGGLHYGPTHISFQANKPCTISWRKGRDTSWQVWQSDTFLVDSTTTFTYKAIDRCGHAMEPQQETYVIRPKRSTFPCPAGMEPVETDSQKFCIDRYEWPNRKGVVPRSYVSVYQAMDSCASVGKRLCSSDEWSLACAGPDSLAYPYGRTYSRHACVTHDTTMRRSGSKPECRAFFGAYDMSGNLAEWTSTPAKRNSRFYNVMGGFWESGPASGCYETRYSYYPQNRHNPVGFRCCKDFASAGK